MSDPEWPDLPDVPEDAAVGDDLAALDDDLWQDEAPPPDDVEPAAAGEPEPGPGEAPAAAPEISLDLDPDLPDDGVPLADVDVDAATLAVSTGSLADVFGVSGGSAAEVTQRLGLGDEVDGHAAAVVLGELGLDAAAEHGDVDALAAAVAAGAEVLVPAAGGPLAVTAVDLAGGTVELRSAAGEVRAVGLAQFEAVWESASYAMVVAEPAQAAGEVALSTGPVVLLGVTWPPG